MAQPSTTYKFELNLTDLDRGVYENVRQTIARHPSETEERMAVRLLAYALWYNENLSFGRGLSDVDEAALWEKSLDDRVLHWIEVGQPDAERLTWCSRRTERTSLLAYGSLRVWQNKVVDAVKGLKNLSIAAVPQDVLELGGAHPHQRAFQHQADAYAGFPLVGDFGGRVIDLVHLIQREDAKRRHQPQHRDEGEQQLGCDLPVHEPFH